MHISFKVYLSNLHIVKDSFLELRWTEISENWTNFAKFRKAQAT